MDPTNRDSHGSSRARAVAVGPYFGGTPMTFLTLGSGADDSYLERTADRLRTMAESARGLDGADPVKVRKRLEHMDRHARRNEALSHSAA